MKNNFLIGLIVLVFSSCTERLDSYVQKNQESYLTIEGGLSDQMERQTIKLYNSISKTDNSGLLSPVTGATIYIVENTGLKINFVETENGIYRTIQNVAGKPGNTYTLFMLVNGKNFESSPEGMPTAPPIDKLTYEGTLKTNLNAKDNNYSGYDVYLSFLDAPEKGNYYRWSWRHYDSVGICAICNGSLDQTTGICSPLTNSKFSSSPSYAYHCNGSCFDITFSQDVNILADDYINGKQVDRVFITRVPDVINENYLSGNRYFLEVEQRALNKESYQFYKQLKDTQSGGSFFDVPAITTFNFNIKCTSDASQKILGLFDVYSSKRKIINIDLSTIVSNVSYKILASPSYIDCIPTGCTMPCIETLLRTKTAPEGW